MQKRSLLILAVVAVAAVASALWMTGSRRAVTETEASTSLVPDLMEQVNDVARIEVRSASDSVTLVKGEQGWTVSEKNGYPANIQNLRKQLIAIADASIIESKTANPDNYSRIGVDDVAAGSESTAIKLEGQAAVVDLVVGKQNFQGQASTYVRRAGGAQSYLVSGNLKMESQASAWLQKDILNVGSPRIRRAVLQHPDGSSLEIFKNQADEPNFTVVDIPEGRELASPSAGNAVAGALGSIRLEDVYLAAEMDPGDAEVVTGIYETFDGLRIHTRAWKVEDQHYVAMSAEFDEALAPEPEAETVEETAEISTQPLPIAAQLPADADAVDHAQEAAEMSAAVEGWVFVIPSYKYGNMSKNIYDLLKPLPVAEPDSAE